MIYERLIGEMSKKQIVVLSRSEEYEFYKNLPVREEKVNILPFSDSQEFLREYDIDVVVLDCGSDPQRGLRLLAQIKESRPDVPVVFLTEVSSEEISIAAFRTGARDFFKKPVNIFELAGAIENILKVKRLSKEQRDAFILTERNDIVEILKSTTSDMPSNILNAVRYIEKHITSEIFIDDIAKIAKLSKFHFCRIFKKIIGMSPMKFVIFMRIQKSKELLRMNDITISKVSAEVGFNDISNFNRYFKQFTNVTPSAYKRMVRKIDQTEQSGNPSVKIHNTCYRYADVGGQAASAEDRM
jgi:AraC family transcriptional regulator